MRENLSAERAKEKRYLLDAIRRLRYLIREGIALQGHKGEDDFTQLMVFLGTKDENIRDHLNKLLVNKYTSHDIQNEVLEIMVHHALLEKIEETRENLFFSITGDEYTDISNKEQLSLCLPSVKEDLEVQEDFLTFYQLRNMKSETIANAIKDALFRFNLQLENCRGQTYVGVSNMPRNKSGVAVRIIPEQPKAPAVHCYGHSLSLAVKQLTFSREDGHNGHSW